MGDHFLANNKITGIFQHFAQRNLTPLIGAEIDNVECAKELTRQKKGVALVFFPYIKEDVARHGLTIITVTDGEIRLGIDIATTHDMAISPVLNAFLGVIEKHFSYLPSRKAS